MKKITIGVFTTSRSEFGVLLPLINKFKKSNRISLKVFAGGSHFLKSCGKTIKEIKLNKIKIDGRFGFEKNFNSNLDASYNLSKSTSSLGKIFNNNNLDYTCIVGDRFELIPVVLNSIINTVPILHIGGGESTIGAIDNQIRNMISKASYLHFTYSKFYSKSLIEMGEDSKKIFTVGSLAIDNIKKISKRSRKNIFKKFKLDTNKKTILLTYHPETLQLKVPIKTQIKNLFKALNSFNFQIIITSPSYDSGSSEIKKIIFKIIRKKKNHKYYESLGFSNYHSLLPHCEFVIGNSSSGLIEVPFYKMPTINIGFRQKGRLRHKSVIDVGYDSFEIKKAIKKAISKKFRKKLDQIKYKFGNGKVSQKIEKIIRKIHKHNQVSVK